MSYRFFNSLFEKIFKIIFLLGIVGIFDQIVFGALYSMDIKIDLFIKYDIYSVLLDLSFTLGAVLMILFSISIVIESIKNRLNESKC